MFTSYSRVPPPQWEDETKPGPPTDAYLHQNIFPIIFFAWASNPPFHVPARLFSFILSVHVKSMELAYVSMSRGWKKLRGLLWRVKVASEICKQSQFVGQLLGIWEGTLAKNLIVVKIPMWNWTWRPYDQDVLNCFGKQFEIYWGVSVRFQFKFITHDNWLNSGSWSIQNSMFDSVYFEP